VTPHLGVGQVAVLLLEGLDDLRQQVEAVLLHQQVQEVGGVLLEACGTPSGGVGFRVVERPGF
jgi:hypothetical protein